MAETMVKPAPRKPKRRVPEPPDPERPLKDVLEMFGNDRAYSFLGFVKGGWRVHFAGDAKNSIVTFEDEKPVIIEEE